MIANKLIDGMASCIMTLDRSRFIGACVASDLMRDGAYAQRHVDRVACEFPQVSEKYSAKPIYWIITENATAIGYDKSLTVDYYSYHTPGSCIGAFVWNGKHWAEYPLDLQA